MQNIKKQTLLLIATHSQSLVCLDIHSKNEYQKNGESILNKVPYQYSFQSTPGKKNCS